MAEVTQIPGKLDIVLAQGDDMSILVDFDIVLTGYTFSSAVQETDGNTTTITVVETDLASGQVTLTMTDTLSGAIEPGTHKWYLDRTDTDNQRRYLAGDFIIIEHKQ